MSHLWHYCGIPAKESGVKEAQFEFRPCIYSLHRNEWSPITMLCPSTKKIINEGWIAFRKGVELLITLSLLRWNWKAIISLPNPDLWVLKSDHFLFAELGKDDKRSAQWFSALWDGTKRNPNLNAKETEREKGFPIMIKHNFRGRTILTIWRPSLSLKFTTYLDCVSHCPFTTIT